MSGLDTAEWTVLARDLTQVPVKAGAEVSAVLRKSMLDLKAEAQRLAPVDTGYLRGMISSRQINQYAAIVSAGANYSVFQEFGTRYMAAQPFMGPASDKVEPAFQQALSDVLAAAL